MTFIHQEHAWTKQMNIIKLEGKLDDHKSLRFGLLI